MSSQQCFYLSGQLQSKQQAIYPAFSPVLCGQSIIGRQSEHIDVQSLTGHLITLAGTGVCFALNNWLYTE